MEDTSTLPCVVYLHGNSSARVDVVKTRSLTVRLLAGGGVGGGWGGVGGGGVGGGGVGGVCGVSGGV